MRWKEGWRTVGRNSIALPCNGSCVSVGSLCICLVFSGGDKLRASNPVIDLRSHFCILASETGSA